MENTEKQELFFNEAIVQVLKNEGGYSNKSSDNGGATKYGITEKVARQNGYTGNMRYLPENKVREIYYKQYWLQSKADKVATISFNIAFLLFDFAVNSGVKNASKKLQIAINKIIKNINTRKELKIDGIIGVKTLAEIEYLDENTLFLAYITEIIKYYTSLKNEKTGFQANGAGWINRVANNIDFLNGL